MAPKRTYQFIIAAFVVFLLFTHYKSVAVVSGDQSGPTAKETPGPTSKETPERTKELVVASVKGEDVSWIAEHVKDWKRNIYVANDPRAPLTVPKNKGRESMV